MSLPNIDQKLVIDGDMSSDIISKQMDMQFIVGASIQAVWTGSPVGVITFEGSNDEETWIDLEVPDINPVNGADSLLVNFNRIFFKHIRLKYTA